jgi:hypothetical protein
VAWYFLRHEKEKYPTEKEIVEEEEEAPTVIPH